MRYLTVLFLAALLVACGGITPSLASVELEPLLIQPGDLPSGIAPSQVSDALPTMFDGLPKAERTIDQRLQRGGQTAGGISVALYADPAAAYAAIVGTMGKHESVTVGERAERSLPFDLLPGFDLAFVRCHALAYVRMTGDVSAENILAYAKRLDARLAKAVC